jgi:hypothetical protein
MNKHIDTEQLKQSIDLTSLIGQYSEMSKASGKEWAGPCPKCGGIDRLHCQAKWWFCRTCYPLDNGKSHDAIAFIQWLEGVDFRAACQRLGATVVPGGPLVPRQPVAREDVPAWRDPTWQANALRELGEAHDKLTSPAGEPGRTYLAGRGISLATAQTWNLGYGLAYDGALHCERPAIWFPWGRRDITGIKQRFLTVPEGGLRYTSWSWPHGRGGRGGQYLAYGLQMASGTSQTLFLCEGELNAISIWQALTDAAYYNWDVISFGAEGKAASDLIVSQAKKYQQVIIWCDKPEVAAKATEAIPCSHGMRSPIREGKELDANALLQVNWLYNMLAEVWHRFDAQDLDKTLARIRSLEEGDALLTT